MRIHYLQHVPFEGIGFIQNWADKHQHHLSNIKFFNEVTQEGLKKLIEHSDEEVTDSESIHQRHEMLKADYFQSMYQVLERLLNAFIH